MWWKVNKGSPAILAKEESAEVTGKEAVKNEKYILYDVNPGEGFNLRRDVFMRVAVLVRHENQLRVLDGVRGCFCILIGGPR